TLQYHLFCFLVFFLDGQVVLKQSQPSIIKGQTKTAWFYCIAEGISDFRSAYIHWYRHIPPKGPEWILFIGSGTPVYDDNSYTSKYSSSKNSTNLCIFSVNNIQPADEGTYYCAYWQYHRTSRPQVACTESFLYPERQAS
ncbi:HVM45 protein, partial [Centropus bengalensis]|nr:HVM45 protein [Centropus bengalensis]